MSRFSYNKDINRIVLSLLKAGWRYRNGRKHKILIAPNNKRIAIPSTPSDLRAIKNFSKDLRRLSGRECIYA